MSLTFKGGIHPLKKTHHGKMQTAGLAIEILPPPEKVSIPCALHLGVSAKPCVEVGDHVYLGQKIAEAGGFVSVPVHASVSGTVRQIVEKKNKLEKFVTNIVIENDFQDQWDPEITPHDWQALTQDELKSIVLNAGCVGLGGAGFPAHVKFSPAPDKKITDVIINGAECEPFLTADHRVMLETPERVVTGTLVVMKIMGVEKGVIALEDNKPDAIAALKKAAAGKPVEIAVMKTKYPQGSEKQIIEAVTGRQVPSGKLPMDAGCVVVNASSAGSIADAVMKGIPVIERVVTVTGSVNQPKNLLVRIGTQISEVLEYCGGLKEDVEMLVAGGPMMGATLYRTDGVISKTTSGLLALNSHHDPADSGNCIRCGRCIAACPIHLQPLYLARAAEQNDFAKAESLHAMDCISCGCCSYVCPAKRYLAQYIKVAKDHIAAERRKKD